MMQAAPIAFDLHRQTKTLTRRSIHHGELVSA